MVNYEKCRPDKCRPGKEGCPAVSACTHKVIKQIDGVFEPPMIFQHLCLACWDCIEACPMDAVERKSVS